MAVKAAPPKPSGKQPPRRAPAVRRRGWARVRAFLRRYWWAFVAAPLLGMVLVLATLVYVYTRLQLPATPPPLQTTYVFDRNGDLLGTLHSSVDRTIIPFSDMPRSLREAVLSAEDKDFYHHGGLDPIGIVRAAWNDLIAHQVVQGGSTITQQLVKNVYAGHYETDPDTGTQVYVTPPRTFGQKIREALLALKLEQTYTKDEILAKYLNTIYFGHGAYGVQAAAQTYWSEDAKDLTLVQSATLAGIISNPGAYDPISDPQAAQDRRNYVLDRMVADGHLERARADAIEAKPVRVSPSVDQQQYPPKLGYFIDYTKRSLLASGFDESQIFGGGLRVSTTLDGQLQHEAEQAVKGRLDTPGDPSAALVAIDPSTGGVLAMVGGRNFQKSQVNLATGDGGSGRQAGSAFKVFTLTAAMEDHISLDSRWYGPSPITIDDPRCYTNGAPWTLSNADDSESGTFTLQQATEHSVNTVFAQVVTEVGPDAVVEVAHRMGITSPLEPVCSITLGTQDVTPLEMAEAYGTLAARGVRHHATPILQVEDTSGEVLDKLISHGRQVLQPNVADLVTSALQTVIEGGTGTNANIGRPAAGKTGTTQDFVDAWFCGYVPQLVTCVWVGYPEGQISMQDVEGYSEVFGGTLPALIWHDFMSQATADMPVEDFHTPSDAGQTGGPPTPAPQPSPSVTPTESPSPSPSESPSPSPSESPSPSPTPPTPSPSASPSPPAAPAVERPMRGRGG